MENLKLYFLNLLKENNHRNLLKAKKIHKQSLRIPIQRIIKLFYLMMRMKILRKLLKLQKLFMKVNPIKEV